ncbi:Hypothetical predicted protein [Pelobates cultripes]|uniref:Uncharacterized protein n=1 Tax=Pelobates cultripes TaxID=61616 RepID=A0AAD1SAI7_PELCU|nr:Hypothetical predicted protein [Pelobates cultripes]
MLLMDRAHRVAKPQHLPTSTPRDVLTKMHYFHVKDTLLHSKKPQHELPEKYRPIHIFTDLSAETRNRKIPYRWGFPIKLLILRERKTYAATDAEAGIQLLSSWAITTAITENRTNNRAPLILEWQVVRHSKTSKNSSDK